MCIPVDDSEQMLLTLLDSPPGALASSISSVSVFTVQEVVGRCWERTSESSNIVGHLEDSATENLVNHDGTHVEIIVFSRGSVNDDRSSDATTILGKSVGVIPTSSIGRCVELVGSACTWSDSTLSDTRNTILIVGAVLSNTVPVDGSGIVGEAVDNSNLDHITPVGYDCVAWCLAVNCKG